MFLVEDEPKLASFIQKGFRSEGYALDVAFDGQMGDAMSRQSPYDLVILDVNLPHVNGFELCRRIREEQPRLPVLLLTALDSLEAKVAGFEAGTDDYLVKPFKFQELVLWVRALLKRSTDAVAVKRLLRLADLELNLEGKTVTRAGRHIVLTAKKYALLEYLLTHAGKVMSRADISEKVWELDFDTNSNLIDVYINHLDTVGEFVFKPWLEESIARKRPDGFGLTALH